MLNREPAGMINVMKQKCHHVTKYYNTVILCMTSFSPAFDRRIPPIFFLLLRKKGDFDDFIFTKSVSIKVRFFKTKSSQCETEEIGINR